MQVTLKALYESYRAQILLTGTDGKGNHRIPRSYLYAVSQRMSPYLHEEWCGGDDPYSEIYNVEKELVKNVFEYLDELWLKKEDIPTFYDLEDVFGKVNRSDLITIIRYCYLDDRFDKNLYASILTPMHHPTEAGSICGELREEELSIPF